MAFDPFLAIRFTPYYAQQTGWPDQLGRVFGVLGFPARTPSAKEFVAAVRQWQHEHPPLDADGMLGPLTWAKLLPAVQAYKGEIPGGVRPDWVDPPRSKKAAAKGAPAATSAAPTAVAKQAAPSPPPPSAPPAAHTPGAKTAEDRALQAIIDEWLSVRQKLKADPFLAVPVSNAYAWDQVRLSIPSLATGGICGILEVGQVWPGISGKDRTIVALIPGAIQTIGSVIFVTDSGQAYYQTVEAWSSDFTASVYADVARKLTPIQKLLEVEAQVLLGAISATSGLGFAVVVGMGTTQWVLNHRDAIARWTKAGPAVAGALLALHAITPTLFDKVFWVLFKRFLAEIPESAVGNAKLMARFIGIVLVKVGKLVLTRDAKVLADALPLLLKRVTGAAAKAAKAVAKPAAVTAAKAIPGAGKAAARGEATDLIHDMLQSGVNLSPDDADRILAEIRQNPDEVRKLIDKLLSALQELLK